MVKIVWAERAIVDLTSIAEYSSRYSESYASIIVSKLFNNVSQEPATSQRESSFYNTKPSNSPVSISSGAGTLVNISRQNVATTMPKFSGVLSIG